MPSKTARDCQFIYWFSPGLTATLRIPTHAHAVRLHTLKSSLTASHAAAAAVQKVVCLSAGSALPLNISRKLTVSLTFEGKKKNKRTLPEIFTLISRHLIRLKWSPRISNAGFLLH